MRVELSICLVVVLVAKLSSGYSSGLNVYNCDVYSPLFGCDPALWVKGNRKACVNESNIMSWVTAAERTDAFRLWLGEVEGGSLSSYTPDEFITVGVSAMEFDRLYRGILLYAEDSEGNKVGNWKINAEAPAVYHQANQEEEGSSCYNTVLHTGASLKAYVTRWKVSFPEGTGTVTFRALIKEGDANVGDFWWPNLEGDVSITEGTAGEADEFPWLLTTAGQSCEELCASQEQELYCDPEALGSLDSKEAMISEIEPYFPCRLPRVGACSFGPAAGSSDGAICYYHESQETCNAEERNYVSPSCDAKASDKDLGSSFCKCTDVAPEESMDAASGLKVNLFVLFFAFMFAGKMEMKKLFFILVLLSLLSGVQSHNWINSNSRTVIASTYAPCLPKNSPKPHIQVGLDEPFQIEWMTGHSGRETFLILINADNYDNLTLHSFKLLNDYINKATVPNTAQTLLGQKLHRRGSPAADFLYQKEVTVSDGNFLERPDEYTAGNSGSYLYQYNASNLADDVRVEYFNADYPWIISVSKFVHSIDLPSEYDIARFVIPNTLPAGNYIVQYMWAGYYDCIDVNYIPEVHQYPSNPVEYPYGYIDDEIPTTYTRVDHCYFPEIQTLYTPLYPWQPVLNGDPVFCLEACRAKNAGCNYVQVVPLQHPAGALSRFADMGGIQQTMDWMRYNETYEMFFNQEHEYTQVCYELEPRFNSQTQGRYVVTSDPNDPHFYTTCYLKNEKRSFIGFEDVKPEKIVTPWRFGDYCISCEDHARISASDYLAPTWVISDTCVNCDAEPQPTPYIEEIAYAMVRNKTYCDGWQSNVSRPDNFQYPYHKTCSEETGSCYKRLIEWKDMRQTLNSCAAAVYNDAECSDIFHFYLDPNSATPENYRSNCWCYKALDCCNGCNPRSTGSFYNLYQVYEASTLVGDPRCENGVASPDFTSCCSKECGQQAACRPGAGTRDVFGFCCSDCIYDRPCSEFQAPCTIDADTAAELLEASLTPEPTATETN